MEEAKVKKTVREGYAKVANKKGSSCCAPASCGCNTPDMSEEISKRIGYSEEEIRSVPEGANLGLGCGNPVALASLKEGETVLDLGSGAGFDCFLAANKVGKNGKVIGVDMTPEMIDKARENTRKGKRSNVEFRLGEIENLPVADGIVDVVISNCVINLSPNKKRVFEEAFRVLKPNGGLMVSDIVLLKKLPLIISKSVEAYIGCISGAEMKDKYLQIIREAGFKEVKVIEENYFPVEDMVNDPTAQAIVKASKITAKEIKEVTYSVASIKVSAIK
ncbi:arsenite methyltransferase [Candidatus Bathyarchaeota archaeon]|nr:arsenite methyltransferase [Candidatus Bathyarchaeota archaeon]